MSLFSPHYYRVDISYWYDESNLKFSFVKWFSHIYIYLSCNNTVFSISHEVVLSQNTAILFSLDPYFNLNIRLYLVTAGFSSYYGIFPRILTKSQNTGRHTSVGRPPRVRSMTLWWPEELLHAMDTNSVEVTMLDGAI